MTEPPVHLSQDKTIARYDTPAHLTKDNHMCKHGCQPKRQMKKTYMDAKLRQHFPALINVLENIDTLDTTRQTPHK
jgi:hypothetical protein